MITPIEELLCVIVPCSALSLSKKKEKQQFLLFESDTIDMDRVTQICVGTVRYMCVTDTHQNGSKLIYICLDQCPLCR